MTSPPDPGAQLLAILGRGAAPDLRELPVPHWDALATVASWHGLASLLLHRLHERGAAHLVPDALGKRLVQVQTLDALRAEARRRQLREVLAALRSHGVPAVVLKGAFLAEHVYPSPALRPMTDLDLLVPEPRLVAANAALVELGYAPGEVNATTDRQHRHTPALRRRGRLPVELHRAIEPCMAPFTLSLSDVWSRTRPASVAGTPALSLSPEDLLLHLAMHMGRSHMLGASLVSVYDVVAWSERFGERADWDSLVARARSSGARRFAFAALALARRALGAAIPQEVLEALHGSNECTADETAVGAARSLLGFPPALLRVAKAVSDPGDSALARVWRVVRSLLVVPAGTHGPGAPVAAQWGANETARPDSRLVRWAAAGRLVLDPAARRAAGRAVETVRWLRCWASDGEVSPTATRALEDAAGFTP